MSPSIELRSGELHDPLVNSNTIDYLWDINAPLIMLRKLWKISSTYDVEDAEVYIA
jgi:hypothetical protein